MVDKPPNNLLSLTEVCWASKFWEGKSICSIKYVFPDAGKPNLQISESSGNTAEEISLPACPALLFFLLEYWLSDTESVFRADRSFHLTAQPSLRSPDGSVIEFGTTFFLLAYLEETWLHSFRETCACLGKPKRKALFYPLSIASPPISHLLPPSNARLAMKACSISLPAVTSHRRPLEGQEMLLTTIRSAQRCGSTLLP